MWILLKKIYIKYFKLVINTLNTVVYLIIDILKTIIYNNYDHMIYLDIIVIGKDSLIMEKIENYAISEEALEGVAGGFKVNKELVKKALIGTSIVVLSAAAGGAAGAVSGYYAGRRNSSSKKAKGKQAVSSYAGIGDLKDVNMEDFRSLFNPVLGDNEWEEYMRERRNRED